MFEKRELKKNCFAVCSFGSVFYFEFICLGLGAISNYEKTYIMGCRLTIKYLFCDIINSFCDITNSNL